MAFPTLAVEFAPGYGPFDTPTWISLSNGPHGNRVRSAEWKDGKEADLDEFPPGEATIVLTNHDRLFDPEYTAGTYFGDLNPRVPFRIRTTTTALALDGTGDFASMADQAALDITGDIDIRIRVAADDWTPAAGQLLLGRINGFSAADGGYSLTLLTGGTLELTWSNGAAFLSMTSLAAVSAAAGVTRWVRATLDVNDGSGNRVARFYTSDDDTDDHTAVGWTQLGATVTTSGTTSIGAGSLALNLGADIFGNNAFDGWMYAAALLNGIGGSTVFDVRFAGQTAGTSPVVGVTGGSWTLSGNAAITAGAHQTHLFYGFVEDGWEQDLRPPKDATCTVRLVDLLMVIQGYTLPSVLEAEILADDPIGYWLLNETSGSTMRDASGFNRDGTYIDGTTQLSTEAESEDDSSVRGIDFDGEHGGTVTDIRAAVLERPFVVEALAIVTTGTENSGATIYNGGSGNLTPRVGFASAVFPDADSWCFVGAVYDGSADAYARTASHPTSDAFHHVAFRGPSAGATSIYIDGVDDTDANATAASAYAAATGVTIGMGKKNVSGHRGFVAHVAAFDSDIGAARIAAHASAALAPLDGLRSDEQIQWALDTIGVPSTLYDLDAGRSIMGPAVTEGRNALDFIRSVTNTEQGAFYVDHTSGGKLRFDERYTSFLATRSTITQATFSDDPAATVHFERGSLKIEPNGVQTVYNQATVSWRSGEEVVDESSGSPYGPRPVQIETESATPAIARGVGQWVVALNDTPRARVRSLTVNPGAAQTAFPTALTTRIRDRAVYRSHPQSVGSATTKALEVLGRHHTVRGTDWKTSFYLTAAPADGVTLFTLGTSTLGGTHVLAY